MVSLENDDSNKQIVDNNPQIETNSYEDEINLMDYFIVLWKRKWFILLATLLPTLIIGITLFVYPRTYEVTYVYDASIIDLSEKQYNVLLGSFYDEDNLNKIIKELQKNKLDKYAQQIEKASGDKLENFVEFEISPPFTDVSVLNITIRGKLPKDLGKIALVIRDNFEEVTLLYMIQEQLSTDIRGYNSKLANIESSRFGLEFKLKNNTEMLAALKKIDLTSLDEKGGAVVVQVYVGWQSQYPPLPYQIQAIELKIVELQGKLKAGVANCEYYKDLLDLDAKVLAELNSKLASGNDYTMNLFKLFLMDLADKYKKPELKDYLASYIKKIENRISISVPVSENPKIHPVARGALKKTSIVFVVALMISVLASFMLEGFKKSQAGVL